MTQSTTNASINSLGAMLRAIRVRKGLTGVELAQMIPLSQSAISKLENGKSGLPEWSRLYMYLDAINADPDERDAVRRQFELAQLDPSSYAFMLANGADTQQRRFRVLESEARLVRDFQNSVIPGLLQTPEYAASVFRILGYDDNAAMVATQERLIRQVAVNDPSKKFIFVILDCALYSAHAGVINQVQQLDYLLSRMPARNISIRVLDSRRGVPVSLSNPYTIIDRRFVSAETAVRELTTTIPVEIGQYERLFGQLLASSLSEAESQGAVENARREFEATMME